MKKLLLSTTLLAGLFSFQAHADYVAPTPSVASQAAQYSIMDINSLIKAAKAGQPGAQFYLATKYQYGKDIQKDERQAFAWYKAAKKNYMGAYQWYELSTRDGMLDNKVITLSEGKKTALAANLTQEQIRQARDRADRWIQAQ